MGRDVVTVSESGDLDGLLARLPIEVRRVSLKKAMRAAASVVVRRAKQPVARPGYPGDKADLKPLRDTIGAVVRDYEEYVVAVVGPQHPAGAHGHLVEYGHEEVLWGVRTGRRVPPHPFLRPAADGTRAEQQAAMEGTLSRELENMA